jgi:UDP-glucose:(heptosyl)LPS alpha-1,3-glucosyltransferase
MSHGCADLRLAVVSPFVDRGHGTERALAELLERLAREMGFEIHLYAQRVAGLTLHRSGTPVTPNSGAILWHKIPSVPGPHLLKFFCWLMLNSLGRAWDRRVHHLQCDLLLSPGVNCFDADVIIVHALFMRLRQLANDDDGGRSWTGLLRHLHRRTYYALLTTLERRIYSNRKVTLAAVSQRTAKLLGDFFHRMDVQVIPNGVDTAQFSPVKRLALRAAARQRRDFREQDFVLLLIGNDWRVKGLDTVLNSMASAGDLPIHLLVAGDDSRDVFRQRAEDLGISQRCHFELPRPDVLDFYAAADVYVSPSREDSFALPVAEAMACGLPAITSACAGVAELINDGVNGFILRNPQDEQDLARLLAELYRDSAQRQRVAEAAAKLALEWDWDRNTAAVLKLLTQAADQKNRSTKPA